MRTNIQYLYLDSFIKFEIAYLKITQHICGCGYKDKTKHDSSHFSIWWIISCEIIRSYYVSIDNTQYWMSLCISTQGLYTEGWCLWVQNQLVNMLSFHRIIYRSYVEWHVYENKHHNRLYNKRLSNTHVPGWWFLKNAWQKVATFCFGNK